MKVGIVGSGSMGTGIAQVAATAGETVVIFDNNPSSVDRAKKSLDKVFNRLVEKGKYTQDQANEIFGRITFKSQLIDLQGSDIIIEAIIENLEVKQDVFKQLEGIVQESAILASNTSSSSIASIPRNTNAFFNSSSPLWSISSYLTI